MTASELCRCESLPSGIVFYAMSDYDSTVDVVAPGRAPQRQYNHLLEDRP